MHREPLVFRRLLKSYIPFALIVHALFIVSADHISSDADHICRELLINDVTVVPF